jgi:hypothetical protein
MRRVTLGSLIVILALPAFVAAGKPGKGKKKHRNTDATVVVRFTDAQRDSVRVYFVEAHGRGKCPPGLAKKNNGCLPPGQAKKRYVVGQPLPPAVEVVPIPQEFSVRIGPPPEGYRYCLIDGDLVKLAIGTQLVVDAIEGLVD